MFKLLRNLFQLAKFKHSVWQAITSFQATAFQPRPRDLAMDPIWLGLMGIARGFPALIVVWMTIYKSTSTTSSSFVL